MRALGDRLVVASLGASAAEVEAASLDEWEEVEIGKGLAQYNSVAIDRVKGMKR
jgi:glutamate 5-kinase